MIANSPAPAFWVRFGANLLGERVHILSPLWAAVTSPVKGWCALGW